MQVNRMTLGALALFATGIAGFAAGRTTPQELVVEPTKQHTWLASLAGDYSGKVSGMMGESDASKRTESVLGGLWSVTHFETTMMGQPVKGIEILGYDTQQAKFVSVWVDSTSTSLTVTEGDYDADARTLTMRGPSTGMDGEHAEMINTTAMREDGMLFSMSFEGLPVPSMTIDYTRKQ